MATPWTYRRRAQPWRRKRIALRVVAAGAAGGAALSPGTATLSVAVTATDATGGAAPYTYQWQRNVDGGAYSNLANSGGVSGATTLSLTDGSVTSGHTYGYRIVYTDAALATVTSGAVTIGGGGGTAGARLVGPSALVTPAGAVA